MTVTSYATLTQVKLQAGATGTQNDVLLQAALDATTTKINERCGRPGLGFNLGSGVTSRVFYAESPEYLSIDDVSDPATMTVNMGQVGNFTSPITPDNFRCLPDNALVEGRPVECLQHYWQFWPTWPAVGVQITAIFGWPAVPADVIEAQLIWCTRLYKRKDSPDGIAGGSDFGPIRVGRMDPDVSDMLADYMKGGFA